MAVLHTHWHWQKTHLKTFLAGWKIFWADSTRTAELLQPVDCQPIFEDVMSLRKEQKECTQCTQVVMTPPRACKQNLGCGDSPGSDDGGRVGATPKHLQSLRDRMASPKTPTTLTPTRKPMTPGRAFGQSLMNCTQVVTPPRACRQNLGCEDSPDSDDGGRVGTTPKHLQSLRDRMASPKTPTTLTPTRRKPRTPKPLIKSCSIRISEEVPCQETPEAA